MGGLISGARRLGPEALADRAARAAAGLAGLGIGSGDLIALYLRNDLPFFEASAAAGLIGAYPTPVNWHYTPDEAAAAVTSGVLSGVAFGHHFISNPDLVSRVAKGIALVEPDPSTFYTNGAKGYTDYPAATAA